MYFIYNINILLYYYLRQYINYLQSFLSVVNDIDVLI